MGAVCDGAQTHTITRAGSRVGFIDVFFSCRQILKTQTSPLSTRQGARAHHATTTPGLTLLCLSVVWENALPILFLVACGGFEIAPLIIAALSNLGVLDGNIVHKIAHPTPSPCACWPGASPPTAGHGPWLFLCVLVWAGACYWYGVGGAML